MSFRHLAECDEISPNDCIEAREQGNPIPNHYHYQTMQLYQISPSFQVGMGNGLAIQLNVPIDIKVMNVEYKTIDDGPYDPPYGDIHHRNEVLAGPGDGRISLQAYYPIGSQWTLGGSLGTTLPWATTEENPFEAAQKGLTHQHFQFGSGTFNPFAMLSTHFSAGRWGGQAWWSGQLPLYHNSKGFQAPPVTSWGIGPSVRIIPPLALLISLEGVHEGKDDWEGVSSPSTGRHALMTGLTLMGNVTPELVLSFQGRATVWQGILSESPDDQIVQRFVATIGVSWSGNFLKQPDMMH